MGAHSFMGELYSEFETNLGKVIAEVLIRIRIRAHDKILRDMQVFDSLGYICLVVTAIIA